MREIKFRAFFAGKMHDEIVIIAREHCIDRKDIGCPLNAGIQDFLSHDDSSSPCVLMQFTELKDKNGKEIYEGDIVKGKGLDYFQHDLEQVEVEYYEGGYYPFADNNDYEPYPKSEDVEVIGNVYENPNLMKENGSNG